MHLYYTSGRRWRAVRNLAPTSFPYARFLYIHHPTHDLFSPLLQRPLKTSGYSSERPAGWNGKLNSLFRNIVIARFELTTSTLSSGNLIRIQMWYLLGATGQTLPIWAVWSSLVCKNNFAKKNQTVLVNVSLSSRRGGDRLEDDHPRSW